MEKIQVEAFRANKIREIKNSRKDKRINKIKIAIFFTVFSVWNFYLMVYILDNLL